MESEQIAIDIIDALEAASIPYMLVGSLSVNCYAPPRSTQDADFVIHIVDRSINALMKQLGPEYSLDPQMGFETVTATMRYIVKVQGSLFKIELFLLSDDPHDRARFDRRTRVAIQDRDSYVATLEDVLVTKLRWSKGGRRVKDVTDVSNIIRENYAEIDWAYVDHWCAEHDTLELKTSIVQELRSRGWI